MKQIVKCSLLCSRFGTFGKRASPYGSRCSAFNVVSYFAAIGRNATRLSLTETTSLTAGRAFLSTVTNPPHIPVMSGEVIDYLQPQGHQVFLDLTFGAGGHSRCILESSPNVRLITLDRDPLAYEYAKELQEKYPERVIPLLGKFSDIPMLFQKLKIKKNCIDGILMDLGVSSMQFDNAERGFMLSKNGPLDMRMDCARDPKQLTASDILTHINEESLYKVLKYFGEEKNARKIARALVESRYLLKKFKTTQELAEFVFSLGGEEYKIDKLGRPSHPATKVFQAIRILVNNELNELDYGLRISHYFLKPRGVLVAIAFHSLEDSVIKRHITGSEMDSTPMSIGGGLRKHRTSVSTYTSDEMSIFMKKPWIPINKHVVLPSKEEVESNPRSRSAKLRAAVKA
ncbi:probable methyltransferase-like protein 15 homolog [Palaemon carinicauda]|uniref:probable methyltransferase-like protein 15 homolog n=1 Tax=Palaemon carinicauda TaxID=392227 RepID=UPI0035B6112C